MMVSARETSGHWPPGRPLLPQAFVDEYKRERCALALSEMVHEVGVRGLTVTLLTKRARMARNTFYSLFENQEAALRYAYELGNRRLREAVEKVDAAGGTLEESVEALLAVAEEEPCLIELCLLHGRGHFAPTSGPFDQGLVETLTAVFSGNRGGSRKAAAADSTVAELLAFGILSLTSGCLRRGETHSMTRLAGPFAGFVRIQLGGRRSVGSSQGSALDSG